MSRAERKRREVFSRVKLGTRTRVQASELLGLSDRQTKRGGHSTVSTAPPGWCVGREAGLRTGSRSREPWRGT